MYKFILDNSELCLPMYKLALIKDEERFIFKADGDLVYIDLPDGRFIVRSEEELEVLIGDFKKKGFQLRYVRLINY